MNLDLVQNVSWDVYERCKIIDGVASSLRHFFAYKTYGDGVKSLIFGISCINPRMLVPERDFDTGFVVTKKYIRSKKSLECIIKLNHAAVSAASENELIRILKDGLVNCYDEISSLNIDQFSIDAFFLDLKTILMNISKEKIKSLLGHISSFNYKIDSPSELENYSRMRDDIFWDLIELSKLKQSEITDQLEVLISLLSHKNGREVIEFENMLRYQLAQSYHYNVLALQKIIENNVDDDSFLDFRCNLILEGREIFTRAIENPDGIRARISLSGYGESLLDVGRRCYELLSGIGNNNTFDDLVSPFDESDLKMEGSDWNAGDLPKLFPHVWKLYSAKR